MKAGVCTVCPSRCKAKCHYHDRSIVVPEQTTVEEIVTSLEKRYREAAIGRSNAKIKCNNLQEAKIMIEMELQKQYHKVKEIIGNLQANCSSFNVTSELSDFIVDVKKDISDLQSKSVIDKANWFIASLEELWNTFKENSSMNLDQHEEQIADTKVPSVSHKPIDTTYVPPKVTIRKSVDSSLQQNYHEPSSPRVTNDNRGCFSFQRTDSITFADKTKMDVDTEECVNNKLVSLVVQTPDQAQMLPVTSSNTNVENKSENFKTYTLDELIRAAGQNRSTALRKELNNRCLGESLGLLTNAELFRLCEQFAELRSKELQELIRIRDKITDVIRKDTNDDPFCIDQVDSTKLLRLAAVNLLIQKAASPENS